MSRQGQIENSPAIYRWEEREVEARPVGTIEALLWKLQASLQDAPSLAAFPGSQLPGYFHSVPDGTKTRASTIFLCPSRKISEKEVLQPQKAQKPHNAFCGFLFFFQLDEVRSIESVRTLDRISIVFMGNSTTGITGHTGKTTSFPKFFPVLPVV